MESENTVCPVCTLYLRPGITLKSHLTSHPKQKVIDALVNLTSTVRNDAKDAIAIIANQSCGETNLPIQGVSNWTQPTTGFNSVPTNHAFIYQQFMSTTSQPPPNTSTVNPVGQQYITIPTVFNPQVMCQPYVYQQQQVIMSAGTTVPSLAPLLRKPQIIDVSNEVETSTTEIVSTNFGDQVNEESKDLSKAEDEQEHELERKVKNYPLHKEEDIDELNYSGEYENVGSPTFSAGSDYAPDRSELNKACQTLQSPQAEMEDTNLHENGEDECFNEHGDENEVDGEEDSNQGKDFDENEVEYECNNLAVVQNNDQVIDMDGMQLILCNNFMGSQLISQVDDFDCLNNRPERAVLMNIGGIDGGSVIAVSDANVNIEQLVEESVSRESTNMSIRADERMPPRGELSGQESNGAASDIAWSRMQYESNSATSTSYDLLARETWEGSDCSDSEVPPLQSRVPLKGETYAEDVPTIITIIEAPLNFKCSSCGERFKCVKERRTHQLEVHAEKEESDKSSATKSNNIIGSKINKKGVKKLVIKPKPANIKTENNFDNVFTNKIELSLENNDQVEPEAKVARGPDGEIDVKENIKLPQCRLCNVLFPDAFQLKLHRQDVHSKKSINRHRCDTCGENMVNETKFIEHLRIHPLECRLCGKYFYRRQNIQLHMKRHLGIKPYMCDFCEKAFLTKQKLEEHKNTHTGEAPIKCTMCDETFRRHSNLVQHRNRHHLNIKKKIKDYICFCGEITHSKKKFAWHQETHDLKPKACTHCNEKFVHMASLTRHMRRAHNKLFVPSEERNSENVECPVCKGIYLRSSLEAHIRNHSGSRPFTCLICNKDFTTKWNLKLHKWTHAARASKPYKCDQCKGAFIRESDYIAHMNSHKSVRPYTCNYCGAQFIRKYNCQRHVKEHEIDKTYTCTICNKGFHRSYYLKDHMRVHSGIRPYSCHICGKTSTTKSNHNKHVMIHHAKEPVSTEN